MNPYSLSGLGCACQSQTPNDPLKALRGLGETFNAAEVIGKSLIAKVSIPVKDSPLDNGKVILNVAPGNTVGVVYSYINPKSGQSVLNWQIEIPNPSNPAIKKYGYVAHGTGKFDVKALIVQGAVSTEQKYEEEQAKKEKENDLVGYYIKKYAFPVLIGAGVIYAITQLGKTVIEKKL